MSIFEAVYPSADATEWLVSQAPWHFLSPKTGGCPICAENSYGATIKTVCGHVFHCRCLLDWFQSLGSKSDYTDYECTCPMCRKVLAIVSPRQYDEVEQGCEEQEEFPESVEEEDEEDATYLAETLSNDTEREETDHLARTLRDEAEQELQHRQIQLQDLLDILYDDEESIKLPPTMYSGCISHEAGINRELEEHIWSSISGSFIPIQLLLSHEQTNEEEMIERRRRMYCTKVQISDADEKIEKLAAMLGNRSVQVPAGQGSVGWF